MTHAGSTPLLRCSTLFPRAEVFYLLLTLVDCSPHLGLSVCGARRSLHIPFSPIGYEGALICNYCTVVLLSCRGLCSRLACQGPAVSTPALLPRSGCSGEQRVPEPGAGPYGWHVLSLFYSSTPLEGIRNCSSAHSRPHVCIFSELFCHFDAGTSSGAHTGRLYNLQARV